LTWDSGGLTHADGVISVDRTVWEVEQVSPTLIAARERDGGGCNGGGGGTIGIACVCPAARDACNLISVDEGATFRCEGICNGVDCGELGGTVIIGEPFPSF